MEKMIRVTRSRVCPICDHASWCLIDKSGDVAICMRVSSNQPKQFKDGHVGYRHIISERGKYHEIKCERKEQVRPKVNVMEMATKFASHELAREKRVTTARQLGVSPSVLQRMMVGIGWDPWGAREFASFPCFDGEGVPIGIVMRYGDGKKLTWPGTSNSGVFVMSQWWRTESWIFVVEGGSDVAALGSYGITGIGRPSNIGGQDRVVRMLKRKGIYHKDIIVVGERDFKHHADLSPKIREIHNVDCEGCRLCAPGHVGAVFMADALRTPERRHAITRIAYPAKGCKDVREMLQAGILKDWLREIGVKKEHIVRMDDL